MGRGGGGVRFISGPVHGRCVWLAHIRPRASTRVQR
jgi:hypothetical protein